MKNSDATLEKRPSTRKYQYAANLKATPETDGMVEEKEDRNELYSLP